MRDKVVARLYQEAESLAREVVLTEKPARDWDSTIDDILTSKRYGYPSMLALLALVLWLTISGANMPSQLLARFLFAVEGWLSSPIPLLLRAPDWLHGLLILGVYRCLAWVVSVMLPPDGHLLSSLHPPGRSRLPAPGSLQLGRLFPESGGPWQTSPHYEHGLWLAPGGGNRLPHHRESPRERLIAILTNNSSSPATAAFQPSSP